MQEMLDGALSLMGADQKNVWEIRYKDKKDAVAAVSVEPSAKNWRMWPGWPTSIPRTALSFIFYSV